MNSNSKPASTVNPMISGPGGNPGGGTNGGNGGGNQPVYAIDIGSYPTGTLYRSGSNISFTVSGAASVSQPVIANAADILDPGDPRITVSVNGAFVANAVVTEQGTSDDSTIYSWTCQVTTPVAGALVVVAAIYNRKSSPVTVNVVDDATPPTLQISNPGQGRQIPEGGASGTAVTVDGTVLDGENPALPVVVAVSLDGGAALFQVTSTPPATGSAPAQWTGTITIPASGSHTITATATNAANVQTSVAVNVFVGDPFASPDPDDSLSLKSYFQDLLGYAEYQAAAPGGPNPTTVSLIDGLFHQSFATLSQDSPVGQVRIAVEVLAAQLQPPPPKSVISDAALAAAVKAYLLAAYRALLTNVGTSYEEIRLARLMTPSARVALGLRLGFDQEPSGTGTKLDQLLLVPGGSGGSYSPLGEDALQSLFGLRSFGLLNSPPAPQLPLLETWQENHLRGVWLQEDGQGDFSTVPIIDPDLLIARDFSPATLANPAYQVWTARALWVTQRIAALRGSVQAGETDQARMARLVLSINVSAGGAPVTMTSLTALAAQLAAGNDISAQLAAIPLTSAAFTYLIQLYQVAGTAANPLLPDEWESFYSILVQTQKAGQFAAWKQEEAQKKIALSPDFFRVEDGSAPSFVLFSTGLADDGSSLADGAVDPHWQIIASPSADSLTATNAFATSQGYPVGNPWVANGPSSRWISPHANQSSPVDVPGSYTYRTIFDLTGQDVETLVVAARVAVDDQLTSVLLNGVAVSLPPGATLGFTGLTEIAIAGPFVVGVNTLDFVVNNAGTGPNPTGLRVEFDTLVGAPDLPAWRAQESDRAEWVEVLTGRVATFDAIATNLAAAVSAAEDAALPSLRDALVASSIAGRTTLDEAAAVRGLMESLQIDLLASSSVRTTRMTQAIQTLQGFLSTLRWNPGVFVTSNGNTTSPWSMRSNSAFDLDWPWMGSYAQWCAAMQVFLYPENILYPSFRDASTDQSQAFQGDSGANIPGYVPALYQNPSPAAADVYAALQAYAQNAAFKAATNGAAVPISIGGQATSVNPFSVAINALGALLGGAPIVTPAPASTGDPIDDLALASAAAYGAWGPIANAGSYSIQKPPLFMYCNEVFYGLAVQAAIRLGQCGVYETALALLRSVYDENRTTPKVDYYLTVEEGYPDAIERTFAEWPGHELNPHATVLFLRRNAYTRFILLQKAQITLAYADAQFTQDTPESLAAALDLYLSAVDLLNSPYLESAVSSFEPNPLVPGLLARAQAALSKLRGGRNVSGLVRPYPTFPGDLTSSSSAADPAAGAVAPTQYKYSTLIDRAKQLVSLAGQIESSYLSSLQQDDNETYNLMKAQQDLETAGATVTLNALQVKEAGDGVTVAKDQKAETQVQYDTYTNWINAGMLPSERTMIQSYQDAADAQTTAADLQAAITTAQAAASMASGGLFGAIFGGVDTAVVGTLSYFKSQADTAAIAANESAQIASVQTSYERNFQQWQLQQATAQANLAVGSAQIQAAQDHLATATQEQAIAQLQDAHAQAIVNFLASKFTSAELYQWMSGVLAGVYAYLLQQATCVAQQAEVQLNFERQQGATSIIKSDYWRAPTDQGATSIDGQATDRRGLTGSARLLEDITQLDQYAFETNKRKLQLTKTFSLATLAPFEFQQFRQTGVLPFATPMSLYDQDFPGHYLRLIKTVRVSVVALVPPNQGVKATLSASGISNVVVPGVLFGAETLVRPPESVAFTSPVSATGVFQLDAQPELILPFESMGVDTAWRLEMPKAANAFDYDTIADVLVSVDYTAFADDSYRSQVIKGLPKTAGADRAYRFTSDFADQWYWLNNPDGIPAGQTPMTVTFDTEEQDFPPNLSNLTIANVLLYFMPADGGTPVEVKASLNFAAPDAPASPPLEQSIGGVISTRRGNAPDWAWMIGAPHSPAQTWTLTLPSDAATQALFTGGQIADILMIVSYQGSLPAWPA